MMTMATCGEALSLEKEIVNFTAVDLVSSSLNATTCPYSLKFDSSSPSTKNERINCTYP
jgi:hypothetical protein